MATNRGEKIGNSGNNILLSSNANINVGKIKAAKLMNSIISANIYMK